MSLAEGDRRAVSAGVEVALTPFDDPAAQQLVAALLADLTERYGSPDEAPPPAVEELRPPGGAFFVAWLDGRPVGCGGLRRHDERSAEIKRMYVAPEARGRGVGRALLAALEEAARVAGYAEVRLETGTAQPEAMALYASSGYVRIPDYGYYRCAPSSRCYGKPLA